MIGEQLRFDFVPTALAVNAMRDNGYKNAAYAIAELIDNSIQAGAKSVELLCVESEEQLPQRRVRRIRQIGVLDNGGGMDAEVLRLAIQFGNGTRLNDRSGIGRFGMGLPSASISQCRRLEVWTWQSGTDKPLHTYLDLGEIERGEIQEVPAPTENPIPPFWRQAGQSFGSTGTLVVWSALDRCTWRTARSIINNSEFVVGRMYRKFIDSGQTAIRMATFLEGIPQPESEDYFLANDPGYLMPNTSTPEPYHDKPMFEKYGEVWEVKPTIAFNGSLHEVAIRFTVASEDARKPSPTGVVAGNQPHGKHAGKNVGVSVMRAGRELELDQSWNVSYDPRERWWGVEVEFPPSLDEVFGVTNNKQTARYFAETPTLESLLEDGQTIAQLRDQLVEEEDPRGPLVDVAEIIRRNLNRIRTLIQAQQRSTEKGTRSRHDRRSAEVRGTLETRKRQAEGFSGGSDVGEEAPAEERQKAIATELTDQGVPRQQARELSASVVNDGIKYIFNESDIETSAFFSVRPRGGAVIIALNISHPAYRHLIELLDTANPEALSPEELVSRLNNAWMGLKLLLEAWARYEDEQPEGPRKNQVQDTRNDWGRVARQFLEAGPEE